MAARIRFKNFCIRLWRRIDGMLAVICFGGTMLFLGYLLANWQNTEERQALLFQIEKVRAAMASSCLRKMSLTMADLDQQKFLVESLTESVRGLSIKTQAIAHKQDVNVLVTRQATEKAVRRAASLAADETVTRINEDTREKINTAVGNHNK